MRQVMLRCIYAIAAFALASQSAASSELDESLRAADTQCLIPAMPSMASRVRCFSSAEEPIFQQKLPAALGAFHTFSQTRLTLAEQADARNAKGVEFQAQFTSLDAQWWAVLLAHEPTLSDPRSTLVREWSEAKRQAAVACQPTPLVEQIIRCKDRFLRPVWQRNAGETIKYYDEYAKKLIDSVHRFDASAAGQARRQAGEYFNAGMAQALADFRANAQRDIQAGMQDAADRQQALRTFSDLVTGIANIALAVAAVKTGQPVYHIGN